jgi:DNA repair photolyase
MLKPGPIKGRGASLNPHNKFEKFSYTLELDDDLIKDQTKPKTEFFHDTTKSIISENNSPDIGFRYSVNPYRGCEHGCAYCYARPSHEYLGYSAGIEFETKIFVKEKAPELLREKLLSKSWKPELIMMSGITDCYQPIERKLRLTRGCLEVLADFRNPVSLITKNALITRDIDLFQEMMKYDCISTCLSVTTLDEDLGRILEPRTSAPRARLKAIEELAKNGIRVSVNVAPVIPGLTDHEIPAILKATREAGAESAGYTALRLPTTVLPVFVEWLEQHRPERKEKVLSLIRSLRGGKLNDANFGSRMRGQGAIAENLKQMFRVYKKRFGFTERSWSLSTDHFRRSTDQLSLF